jgi:endonuclease G
LQLSCATRPACVSGGRQYEAGDGLKSSLAELDSKLPAKLWKVVVVLPSEDAEPRKNTRVIAILMPNDQTVGFDWSKYRVSVKEIEKLTGYKFFPNLPDEIAAELKAKVDEVEIPAKSTRPKRKDKNPE